MSSDEEGSRGEVAGPDGSARAGETGPTDETVGTGETPRAAEEGSDPEPGAVVDLASSLGGLLAQLGAVAEQLDDASEDVSDVVVEGSSAGGAVVIKLTGGYEAVSVEIDSHLVDPSETALLEDAVLAALRDALDQVAAVHEELGGELESTEPDLSSLLAKLGGLADFAGLDLGSLGSLGNLGNLGSLAALGNLGRPEDFIAGLSGALGGLSGDFSGTFGTGAAGGAAPAESDNERDPE